jgi:hypothetical protein
MAGYARSPAVSATLCMAMPTGAISDKTFKTGDTGRSSLFFESAHWPGAPPERQSTIATARLIAPSAVCPSGGARSADFAATGRWSDGLDSLMQKSRVKHFLSHPPRARSGARNSRLIAAWRDLHHHQTLTTPRY